MSGFSGSPGLPKTFEYKINYNLWVPELSGLHTSQLVSLTSEPSDDNSKIKKRNAKRTRKSKKKHSKSSKKHNRHNLEGYILQIIGILCFILAAIKSFEPLTGVGFTLVLLGYNKNARKESRIVVPSEKEPASESGEADKKGRKRRKHHTEKHEEVENIRGVESVEGIESGWELISH